MTRHKHADLIHAWAEGAEIEVKDSVEGWRYISEPNWYPEYEYRIKPKTIRAARVYLKQDGTLWIVEYGEAVEDFVKWVGDWQEYEI